MDVPEFIQEFMNTLKDTLEAEGHGTVRVVNANDDHESGGCVINPDMKIDEAQSRVTVRPSSIFYPEIAFSVPDQMRELAMWFAVMVTEVCAEIDDKEAAWVTLIYHETRHNDTLSLTVYVAPTKVKISALSGNPADDEET